MHKNNILFRDLKPENILIDQVGYIKLADFGMSKILKSEKTYTYCGTPEYLAPEIVTNNGHGFEVDYWAIGILLFEFKFGQTPFKAKNHFDTYRGILQKEVVLIFNLELFN